jgi:divalent metal cation (Fe/Co/Zn/Cd) transporter
MFVEMHLHIANQLERDHIVSHAITEEIERKLAKEFGKVTATIHVEPSPQS